MPGWGDLDRANQERVNELAAAKGIQLFRELTTPDGPLEAVIEDGSAGAPDGDDDL